MTMIISFLTYYLFTGVILWSVGQVQRRFHLMSAKNHYQFALVLLLMATALPMVDQLWDKALAGEDFFRPMIKQEMDFSSLHHPGEDVFASMPAKKVVVGESLNLTYRPQLLLISLQLLMSFGGLVFLWRLQKMFSFLKQLRMQSLRRLRVGRVHLYLLPDGAPTLSYGLWPLTREIFIAHHLMQSNQKSLALMHEVAHIRSHHALVSFLLSLISQIFWFVPFIKRTEEEMAQLQEMMADESVSQRLGNQEKILQYARLLLTDGEHHQDKDFKLVGATSLTSSSQHLLRRIKFMKENVKKKMRPSLRALLAVAALSLSSLTALSYAKSALVVDREVTMDEAQDLLKQTQAASSIPVYLDQDVLMHLNRAVSTERGRLYMRSCLKRMGQYQDYIQVQMQSAQLPPELMAVAWLESGFQNFDNGTAAGIWSFTPGTARRYGLRVNDNLDERFDYQKLTGAAIGYYSDLIKVKAFAGDWHLALLAYNTGERRLHDVMKQLGTSNPREIIKKEGVLNRENREYLPRLMAVMMIMKNPDLIKD